MNTGEIDQGGLQSRVWYQILAPLALLLMAIAAPVGLSFLKSPTPSLGLAQFSVLLFVFVAIMDIVVAWAFFHLFSSTDKALSSLTMLLRLIYSTLLLASLSGYSALTLPNFGGSNFAELYLKFDYGWTIALVIFGLHLVFLGILILKSKYYNFVLGVLVIVSGLGYTIDSIAKIVSPESQLAISTFTFLGEVLLIGWLPINAYRLNRKTRQSAR